MIRLAIFLLFLGSGMTGLIYQLVWTKYLTLVFGVSLLAISTVLTCFFGGLALGSWLGGRWVDRFGRGFTLYGMAEVLIGLYALIFPFILDLNNSVYTIVANNSELGFWGLALVKFVLSACILLIPTTLMGATLPILSKTFAGNHSRFARDIGGLYSINTVGAVIGAVITTFVLIPGLGLKAILLVSGALNIAIGLTAVYLGRRHDHKFEQPTPVSAAPEERGETIPKGFALLLVLTFGISGFTGLAYEVVWSRTLGFILTGTIYAFTAVLAAFLSGIALGSFAFSLFADRFKRPSTLIALLAAVDVLIGLSSIGLINLYDAMPTFDLYSRLDATQSWSEFIWLNFFTSYLTLLLPAFLFGATFPLVCKIYNFRPEGVGRKIGNVYSVNTVGGILGSFAGGFILIPLIGMQKTIVLMGLLNIAIGAAIMLANPFARRSVRYWSVAAMAAAAVIAILPLPENMPLTLHKSLLRTGERIVFYKEGPAATVLIAEKQGAELSASNKRLWINGNAATAAFYEGLQINRFQGVLPMVLHPDPKDVLVICFGSGTTFGTLSQFPVNRVDNVEIAATIIEGAHHFSRENMDVLNNPRSKRNIDDGRSFLAATSRKFDVITEEPMHPSLVGVVNLYTKEYYELAKAHLKPGGIMSQWIPLYNVSVEDMKMLVSTFQSVFPHTTIWLANADIFMIGSPDRTVVDYSRVLAKLNMPNVKRLLTDIDLEDPNEFLGTFVMNEDMVRAYANGAPVMTDDLPEVEFSGPKALHINTISPNLAEFLKFREPVVNYLEFPENMSPAERGGVQAALNNRYSSSYYNIIGRAYFAASNFQEALKYFKASLEIDPTDRNSLHYRNKLRFYDKGE